jgi:predicted flap endonuclease-1-like 5' DNA nuclease
MATYKLSDIKGIGEATANVLAEHGLKTTEDYLAAAATKEGRADLVAKTGLDAGKVLRWTNMADLFRLKGVAEEYSNLLEKAGVDTVKELRNRVPANLHAKMEEVNDQIKLVERTPTLASVEAWVAQAKELDPVVTY